MGFVKKAFKAVAKPFESGFKELGRAGDDLIEGISGAFTPGAPTIDTSAQTAAAKRAAAAQEAAVKQQAQAIKRQEAAASKAAAESRKAADQAARNARWQAEGAAQQFASQQQREQLQQAALEDGANDLIGGEADVQVGDALEAQPERAKRRQQFQAAGGSGSKSPSIRI